MPRFQRAHRPVVPGWPDAAIAEIADRQQTMVAHCQLRALGVSASAIDRARARGRLHPVHRGVYSLVPHAARPPLAAGHAAILAGGPHAVLSCASAAAVHGLEIPGRPRAGAAPVHVTVVGTHRHSRAGLIVHRVDHLHAAEHHRLHGLPVTSVARAVLDLAPSFADPALETLIDRALRLTSATKLREATARHSGRPGTARVAAWLDPARPSADTWSRAERRLRRLIVSSGLPAPESNVALGDYTPDLLWREQRVIVEYDSAEFHSGPAAVRWDTARHNHLTALGYAVIHVTRAERVTHPDRGLVQIPPALARGRG